MFNREQRRRLEQHSKTELVTLLEECERKNGVLTLQIQQAEQIAADHTKIALNLVLNTITIALKETLLATGTYTEVEINNILISFMDNMTKRMDNARETAEQINNSN